MAITTPYPKFAARYLCAVALLICFAQYTWAQGPSPTPTPPCPTPTPTSSPTSPLDVNIVAHQDDDILFMNPDILKSVVAGHRQVTVYITSGSQDHSSPTPDPTYAMHREAGAIEGYQKLLQLADAIRADRHHFNDLTGTFQGDSKYPAGCASPTPHCFPCAEHADELSTPPPVTSMETQTLPIGSRCLETAHSDDGRVLLIFLRVQQTCAVDGRCPDNQVDLATLFTSPDNNLQIGSDFDQPGYTKQQLGDTLVDILNFVRPDVVRTQDPAYGIDVDYPGTYMIPNLGCPLDDYLGYTNPQFYDHSDHVWGARFANEAVRRYNRLPNVESPTSFNYRCYNLEWNEALKTRVSTKDFCLKKSIFFRYAIHDDDIIADPDDFSCFYYFYIGYQKGQQKNLH